MSLIIDKKESVQAIRKAIEKASSQKKKKPVNVDLYFGKVKFGIDGLTYQKKVRDEWE